MQDAEKENEKQKIEEIRPALQADGGDIELVSIDDDDTVQVRLRGACAGCPGAMMTLQFGVQRVLQEAVPAVKRVVPVRE
jgi:Fe-S cluster biogenesis protein NfuA